MWCLRLQVGLWVRVVLRVGEVVVVVVQKAGRIVDVVVGLSKTDVAALILNLILKAVQTVAFQDGLTFYVRNLRAAFAVCGSYWVCQSRFH